MRGTDTTTNLIVLSEFVHLRKEVFQTLFLGVDDEEFTDFGVHGLHVLVHVFEKRDLVFGRL